MLPLLVGPEEDLEDILFPQVAEVFLLGRGWVASRIPARNIDTTVRRACEDQKSGVAGTSEGIPLLDVGGRNPFKVALTLGCTTKATVSR